MVASFKDGNKENYLDQINVDELEQKSMERAKQVTYRSRIIQNTEIVSSGSVLQLCRELCF